MTEKSLAKYDNEYDKALVRNGSVLGLLDQLIELNEMKPYLEISSDEEIKTYFDKKEICVKNKKELGEFYSYLENKVAELSDSSDERVKLYFEKREYLKQLEALPSSMSKLEGIVNFGFEELKVPFKAILNYVWDAVINNGFKIEEEGKKALEKYEGKIKIGKSNSDGNPLEVLIWYDDFVKSGKIKEFYLEFSKEEIEKENIKEIKKKFLFFKKEVDKEISKVKKSKDFFVSETGGGHYNLWSSGDSVEEFIEEFREQFVRADEETQKDYCNAIKTILNLPKIMDNYVKRKQDNLTKMFGELK